MNWLEELETKHTKNNTYLLKRREKLQCCIKVYTEEQGGNGGGGGERVKSGSKINFPGLKKRKL